MKVITARPHRLLGNVIDRIGALIAQGERCMLIVPSQFTLQAEVEVMQRLNLPGSFLIDVLSPSRLRSRVFERAGEPDRVIIDERGKCMMLSAVLEDEKENLTVYRAAASGASEGLAMKLSGIIADFKRSDVSPESLLSAVHSISDDDPSKNKLGDIQRIYAAYESRMHGRLADDEDVAQEMRARLKRSAVLENQHVFVFGFDMITPSFASDLIHMLLHAKSISIAIETDKNSAPDGRLFAPVNASIDRLAQLAASHGIAIEREALAMELDAPADIRLLERNLFALGADAAAEAPSCITIRAAASHRAEVHHAASMIRKQLSSGEDPAQIAIVYPKNTLCGPLLENILPQYGLSVYVAEKRMACAHPLCRFLIAALSVVSGGCRTEDVIEYAQSGFAGISREETDALSIYAECMDLRTDAWKKPFEYMKKNMRFDLDALNSSRERLVEPLIRFGKSLSTAKNGDDAVLAVMALLDEVKAFETLADMRDELIAQHQDALAQDCAQVYNKLMETLDQLHTLLGKDDVSPGSILLLLKSGLKAMELSALPPVDNAVICGEIGNVRTARVSTLYVIAMNDIGGGADSGLLTPQEAEEAERATNAYLGMSAAQQAALAQLDVLKVMSGAKKQLIVSYALADDSGRALREDGAVSALRRLFPGMNVQGGLACEDMQAMLSAPKATAQALSVMLSDAADGRRPMDAHGAQAYAALAETQQGSETLLKMTRKLSHPVREKLNASQARSLYGRPVMSVSRLETFAQCPYRHFVRYGLAPDEELQPGVDRAELGTLYHEAAEQFTRQVSALAGFPVVDEKTCDAIMDDVLMPLLDQWSQSPLGRSRRGASIAARISKTARRAARNILSQYAGGGFRPMRSELIFGQNDLAPIALELDSGTVIYLQGRIDRVDVMDGDRIRIIDYKSGTKKFDPTMAYWGLQLQLMLYLAAALSRIPGTSAAGFFYCRIADPVIRSESRVKEEIERQLAKKLSLAGISLSDVSVLRAHGESHASMITKDGRPNGRFAASMVDEEGMKNLVSFAREKASGIASEVYRGVIDDTPAEYGQFNACAHCDYAAVCGFDPARGRRKRLTAKKLEDMTARGNASGKTE
ncbi:MAG: PD-(D/E)XK nuclease family protein [Clostridia bacterium]|nr:PD-(D/E)XK nuclease family protein [Clostridia bacterium]